MSQIPLMCKSPAEYDAVAILAQKMGSELLQRLEVVALKPKKILDIGSGTGFYLPQLKKKYPDATLIPLDVHFPLLQFARSQKRMTQGICANTIRLPFKTHSIDLLIANLVLPWCSLEKTLSEWYRVLKPEGLLIFTSLGPDTLKQIPHIEPALIDMHQVGDALIQIGFKDPILDVKYMRFSYRDRQKLLFELQITDMIDGSLSLSTFEAPFMLTYEVIFGHAWRGAETHSTFKIPVDAIRRLSVS